MAQRTLPLVFTLTAIAAALWGYVAPRPYGLSMAILIVLPWLSLAAIAMTGGKAGLALSIASPSLVLGYRAFHDFHLTAWIAAAALACAIAAAFLAAALFCSSGLRRNWGWLLVLFPVLAVTYGYGALLEANMLLAVAPAKRFTAAIVNRERYRGRRYVTYDVVLGPWGGRSPAGSQVVSPELYYALRTETVACVDLNAGAFGVEYYQIRACSQETR
jgi:hypothetical protein